MKIRVNEIFVPLDFTSLDIGNALKKRLEINLKDVKGYRISKKSIDARKKYDIKYVLSVDVVINKPYILKDKKSAEIADKSYVSITSKGLKNRPVVVGFGPAGMFSALILAEAGENPIVLERGSCIEDREIQVKELFKNRILNQECNVQFGEGGAGTFSDGKLNTGTKDPRIKKVFEEFVRAGAPKEIMYETKPHIGTDNLPTVVKNIRKKIISLGGEVHFNAKMTEIMLKNSEVCGVKFTENGEEKLIETDNVILALGHSARDSMEMLHKNKIAMEQKAFSVGVRIEHKAEMINKAQYGNFHDKLPTADYKLFTHLQNGRGVYTFCMCPGGEVVAAASEEGRIATNGMSNFARDGKNSNSAVLVGVTPEDFPSKHVLSGMHLQRKFEEKAFLMAGGNYNAPCQRFEDFQKNRASKRFGDVLPSYEPGVSFCDLNKLFPKYISDSLKQGIKDFSRRLWGFDSPDALLTAPETRSSSPVRILRTENFNSLNTKGLYPCGEGAGYAGGISSAAVDGIRCAEAILQN